MIRYDLHQGGHSTLRIYNVRGQEVRTLVDDNRPAGFWSTEWDGRDNTGNSVGSGVYLYKLETPAFSHSKKMTLIR
jgi:flagellar hook assembly protein FlgD